jgi:DNA-binding NtrC family response regulator
MPESTKVVDSWAMVAWIQGEPAAPFVRQFLLDADSGKLQLLMSWFNVAETFYILAKRKHPAVAEEFLDRLPSLPVRLVLPDEDEIIAAARIKAAHPVAFGDAFAIALAQSEQASIITGDDEIRQCGVVSVDWIGSAMESREKPVETLADAEEDQIRRVLAATGGNKSKAAQILGIERKTLYRKLEKMKL